MTNYGHLYGHQKMGEMSRQDKVNMPWVRKKGKPCAAMKDKTQ